MISGEKIGQNSDSKSFIACDDPLDELSPWLDQTSEVDGFPSPSSYSSCEESELERYCSANSVIGTASLCSSLGTCNEFLGSEFGSFRSVAIGRSSGSRSVVAVSESLDCLSDGGNEFQEENTGFGNQLLEGETVLSECKSDSESLLGSSVNSPSSRANCEENIHEILNNLGVGGESELSWSPCKNFQSCSDVCEENNDRNETPSGIGSVSVLSLTSGESRKENPMSQSGGNGFPLLPNASESYPSYEAIHVANNDMDLPLLSDGDGVCLLQGCDENSLLTTDICEDKNIEDPTEHVHDGSSVRDQQLVSEKCVQVDGRESGTVQEDDEETSLRSGHSDAEDSLLDYGTEDEDRTFAEQRNLQYIRETKIKKENTLLMNSVVAFGSDDWDEYMQETEGNTTVPVLFEKPLEQRQEHLETEKTHLAVSDSSLSSHADALFHEGTEQDERVRDVPIASYQVQDISEFAENLKSCSVGNFSVENDLSTQNPEAEKYYTCKVSDASESHMTTKDDAHERELQCICSEEPVGLNEDGILKDETFGMSDLPLDPLSNIKVAQLQPAATEAFEDKETELCDEQKLSTPFQLAGNSHHISVMQVAKNCAASIHLGKEYLAPAEDEKLETDEFYDEMVHEMEEILLDSGRPHGARFSYSSQRSLSQLSQPFRDGGSTASTSGTDDAYPPVPCPLKIDWVEVVGAKQKRGDVSFGERLVGVKEYTVYIIRVWSGKDQWDVERRYRDFYTLYRQLKTLFTDRGCSLPTPWSRIDRESRKIFGNASPNVISDRSILIQDCIRSILSECPFSTPSSIVWFLSPCKSLGSSSTLYTMVPHSIEKLSKDDKLTSSFCGETFSEGSSSFGKTISLVVEIKPRKSVEQLLEAQYYTCAGCHRHLDAGKSLMQDLVQTFGWGKPRLCEYTNQLFCASCHSNDTAVLPARVLHFWDFSLYPVSQLAKAYLESIHDQPMLCVSAVNPFLFSRVPTLLHVTSIRKKIGAMFPYLQCPFRRSIQRGLGSRRYLLENSEFFALRDLVDLSKGAFAALPALIETVSMKIHEHITQQCLVCCDVGIPCGARQACEDPASLIFPFQEAEVARCSSCDAVFHKPCFGKLASCPCGTMTEVGKRLSIMEQGKQKDRDETEQLLDISTRKHKSNSAVGFFSDLWRPRKDSPVILMGSLPSTAL